MTELLAAQSHRIRHTYRFDLCSAVLDAFFMGTVFQLLVFVGRKAVLLTDSQHNVLMAALHVGLLATPLVQAIVPLRRKEFVLATWIVGRCSCLLLLFPYFHHGWPFALLATWIMSFSVLRLPAHSSILRSNYPAEIRNRVLSRVRLIQLLVTVPSSLIVGMLIELSEALYFPLAVLSALLSLAGAWQYSRIQPCGEVRGTERTALVPLHTLWHIFRHDRQFCLYELLYTLGGIPNLWSLPLYVRFISDMEGGLGARWWEIAIMVGLLQPVITAISLPSWGRLHDWLGTPLLQRAVVCVVFALHPMIFYYADSVAWAYAAYIVFGFVSSGASLNWILGALSFGKPEQATAYSSIHTMLTGVRGVIAPWIGTLLAHRLGLRNTFLLAAAVMLLSSLLLVVQHVCTRKTWSPSME